MSASGRMAVPVRFIDPFRAGQARYLLQGQPTADILDGEYILPAITKTP